jgi:hypothetical protein
MTATSGTPSFRGAIYAVSTQIIRNSPDDPNLVNGLSLSELSVDSSANGSSQTWKCQKTLYKCTHIDSFRITKAPQKNCPRPLSLPVLFSSAIPSGHGMAGLADGIFHDHRV